jgi:hyperosmotically inducible protein
VKRVSSEIQSPDRLGDAEIAAAKGPRPKDASMTSATYDAWITTDVKARLLATADVPALEVNVDTNNGIVTLFGSVPTETAKRAAEAEVKKIDGVKAVQNELQIVPKSMAKAVEAKDDDIRKNVDSRLEARPELKDASIDSQVEKGVVRLTCSVASQSDRLIALTTTRATPGVRSVIDDLNVIAAVSSR